MGLAEYELCVCRPISYSDAIGRTDRVAIGRTDRVAVRSPNTSAHSIPYGGVLCRSYRIIHHTNVRFGDDRPVCLDGSVQYRSK